MRPIFVGLIGSLAILTASTATPQTAREVRGPAAIVPVTRPEPPARIVIDPPIPEMLALGRVVIQYRTENLRIVPVFGADAAHVSPRVGHIHVTVDDAPWRWVDASCEPITINGLPAGEHTVRIDLADANHQTLDKGVITFTIPEGPTASR